MMMNLFSSFDPTTNIMNLSINWTSSIIGLMFIPNLYWMIMSRTSVIWFNLLNSIHNELKVLMMKKNKGSTLLFFSLFSFIMMNNFLGIFPYIFTSTSHLTLSLTLSIPLWLSFMLYGWINKTNHMFIHLVPQNTPTMLMPFMVMIETISNVIRTITLSVRLSANMIAGHLLMTLLSNLGTSINNMFIMFLILIQTLLLSLESAVAIIQSYVFMVLTTLYSSEIN